jgi:hypothetical protein
LFKTLGGAIKVSKFVYPFITFGEFILSSFENTWGCPRILIHHPDPSMDSSIRIV